MELNISAEDTEQHRRQNPSLSLQNRECQNDLNAPGRVESIDDNTKLPGYDNNSTIHNIPVHGRQCMASFQVFIYFFSRISYSMFHLLVIYIMVLTYIHVLS